MFYEESALSTSKNVLEKGAKIAVCGKGGVGKTLIAGTMARILARKGFKVLAVDVDSNPNLHTILRVNEVKPLSLNEDLVEEKTGVKPGSWGAFFVLNPKVDDIPERYAVRGADGVLLLSIGMPRAGAGCMCPQNALIKALVDHLVLERNEIVVLDMEAGLEHFGRATARSVDLLLVVLEPTMRALETAVRILYYAGELKIPRIWGILNKVRDLKEVEEFTNMAANKGLNIKTFIPYDPVVVEAEQRGIPVLDFKEDSIFVKGIEKLCEDLINELNLKTPPYRNVE